MKIATALAGLALVASTSLTGCSDGTPVGPPATPESTSPGTTERAEPDAPEMPEAAKKKTRDGAAAFVAYYWDAVDFGMETGELDTVTALSTRACRPCRLALQSTQQFFDAGGSQEGGSTTATVDPLIWDPRKGTATTLVRLATTAGSKSFGGPDARVERFPATSYSFVMGTRWMDGRWHVESMEAR